MVTQQNRTVSEFHSVVIVQQHFLRFIARVPKKAALSQGILGWQKRFPAAGTIAEDGNLAGRDLGFLDDHLDQSAHREVGVHEEVEVTGVVLEVVKGHHA